MSNSHHAFVADQYGPRANAYVLSAVHAGGEDLDQLEAAVRGCTGARVLDLGCGGGHVGYRVAPHVGEVVAVDLSPEMLNEVTRTAAERGLRNLSVQQSPAERLPFADGRFDIVLSRFSAHHWHDLDAGLREARRVLAAGGRAIFIDVISPARPLLDTHLQVVETLRDPSHARNYTAAEWVASLSRAGFTVNAITPRRLRMDFATWTARTRTPDLHAQAIRSLQATVSEEVRHHFAIEADGSFLIDTLALDTSVP
ncbi:class I SAM-dependent methyltransferase [Azospirillum sp.]|uniref:class I SAM-dependent methyltransferase n=1 Tax=Azospirillum sp. TaxID=34012 RepID=UPI003D714DDB